MRRAQTPGCKSPNSASRKTKKTSVVMKQKKSTTTRPKAIKRDGQLLTSEVLKSLGILTRKQLDDSFLNLVEAGEIANISTMRQPPHVVMCIQRKCKDGVATTRLVELMDKARMNGLFYEISRGLVSLRVQRTYEKKSASNLTSMKTFAASLRKHFF